MKNVMGIVLGFSMLTASYRASALEKIEKVGSQKPDLEIEQAIAVATEIDALNSGLLDARSGVFHPKVQLPGADSESGASLSK